MNSLNAIELFAVLIIIVGAFGWQYLYEKALVKQMTKICETEYNKTYLYHDSNSFYCVKFKPRSTFDLSEIDMVEIRYSG
jgi:hypothetical protein